MPTKTQPNTAQQYQVKAQDLPLCCPMPHMQVWNSHPRVYLPIEEAGQINCPYCGTLYLLKDHKPKE